MTLLVACLLTGKGTWTEVTRLITNADWEKIILVTNDFGHKNYASPKKDKTAMIVIDDNAGVHALLPVLTAAFSGLFGDVAVNLCSGAGSVHMAVISALLKSGAGIRLVTPTEHAFDEV